MLNGWAYVYPPITDIVFEHINNVAVKLAAEMEMDLRTWMGQMGLLKDTGAGPLPKRTAAFSASSSRPAVVRGRVRVGVRGGFRGKGICMEQGFFKVAVRIRFRVTVRVSRPLVAWWVRVGVFFSRQTEKEKQ